MTKKKRKPTPKSKPNPKPQPPAPPPPPPPVEVDLDDEVQEIADTRRAIQPLLDAGMSHFRLASAAGTHPEDMRGFVEGRISLTPMLRARLRSQIRDLLDSLRPRG